VRSHEERSMIIIIVGYSISCSGVPEVKPCLITNRFVQPPRNDGSTFPSIIPGIFQAISIKMDKIIDISLSRYFSN